MISAFTLIRVPSEERQHVLGKLKELSITKEAAMIYGEFDIIVRTETTSIKELNRFTYNVLRKISDITMTTTMIVAHIPRRKRTKA